MLTSIALTMLNNKELKDKARHQECSTSRKKTMSTSSRTPLAPQVTPREWSLPTTTFCQTRGAWQTVWQFQEEIRSSLICPTRTLSNRLSLAGPAWWHWKLVSILVTQQSSPQTVKFSTLISSLLCPVYTTRCTARLRISLELQKVASAGLLIKQLPPKLRINNKLEHSLTVATTRLSSRKQRLSWVDRLELWSQAQHPSIRPSLTSSSFASAVLSLRDTVWQSHLQHLALPTSEMWLQVMSVVPMRLWKSALRISPRCHTCPLTSLTQEAKSAWRAPQFSQATTREKIRQLSASMKMAGSWQVTWHRSILMAQSRLLTDPRTSLSFHRESTSPQRRSSRSTAFPRLSLNASSMVTLSRTLVSLLWCPKKSGLWSGQQTIVSRNDLCWWRI